MSPLRRAEILMPYENTSRLFDEMANLKIKVQSSTNMGLERISPPPKDRVSALEYVLWRIKAIEDELFRLKKRKKRNIGEFIYPKG